MSTVGGAIFLAVVCFLGWFPYKKTYKDPENVAQVIQTEGCDLHAWLCWSRWRFLHTTCI